MSEEQTIVPVPGVLGMPTPPDLAAGLASLAARAAEVGRRHARHTARLDELARPPATRAKRRKTERLRRRIAALIVERDRLLAELQGLRVRAAAAGEARWRTTLDREAVQVAGCPGVGCGRPLRVTLGQIADGAELTCPACGTAVRVGGRVYLSDAEGAPVPDQSGAPAADG